MKPVIYYAQNREDIILSCFLEDVKNGFYVDVGAHDPVNDSVTKFFYKKGWNGINIEPQPEQFKKLKKDRKRDINLQVGISNKKGKLKIRSYKDGGSGLSTFSEVMKNAYKETADPTVNKYEDIEVEVDTLASVLGNYSSGPIHFLKIDVEGLEYEVLESNNWKKFRPEVICIEANHIIKDWRPVLTNNNYLFAYFDGLNEYYVSEKSSSRIILFKKRFPELLGTRSLLSNDWSQKITKNAAQLEKVQRALDQQIIHSKQLQEKVNILEKNLKEYDSIAFLSKRLIRKTAKKLAKRANSQQ